MADEFHKVFCRMLDKYSLNAPQKKMTEKMLPAPPQDIYLYALEEAGSEKWPFRRLLLSVVRLDGSVYQTSSGSLGLS